VHLLRLAEFLLGRARRHEHGSAVLGGRGGEARLHQRPLRQRVVEIVSAQGSVAARGHHLEDAARQAQQGDVEGAAAEVVHRVETFAALLQAVRHRSSRGLVEQAQHVQARQLGRVLGGLTLRVVEVGRHGDDGAVQFVVEGVLCALAQRGEDLGRDLHWRLLAIAGGDGHHAGTIDKGVGQLLVSGHVGQAPTHQPLDRGHGVDGVFGLRLAGLETDLAPPALQVTHHRGQDRPPLRVGQALGHAVAHRGHERVGRAQVDAHRDAPLVRVG
jgi:hypothetical protein